jgi:cobaltochelatase CobT
MTGDEGTDGYRAYTRDFDRVVRSEELDDVLGRLSLSLSQRAALDEAWEAFQSGLVGWRTAVHLAALNAAGEVRRMVAAERLKGTVVALLVDQSGSMRGQKMLLAAAAADVAQDFLGGLGCKVEVLGFTTASWKGGRARRRWVWRLRPRRPGRLCDLLHVIYRDAEEARVSTGSWNFRAMLRADLPKENVDGEALEWAADRLRALPERRKIIVVLSDGAPVDDSTLLANGPDILDRHLKRVVRQLEGAGDVELAALGIGFDVSHYYAKSALIQAPEEMGTALIALLGATLKGQDRAADEKS